MTINSAVRIPLVSNCAISIRFIIIIILIKDSDLLQACVTWRDGIDKPRQHTTRTFQFKLVDNNAEFFAAGTSAAVLWYIVNWHDVILVL